MLDVGFEDEPIIIYVTPDQATITCDVCGKEAFIFQEEGNFCLSCWQDRTEPDITTKEVIKRKSSR